MNQERKLYKFISIDKDNVNRVIDVLNNGELYCPYIKQLNDPLEGRSARPKNPPSITLNQFKDFLLNADDVLKKSELKYRILSLTSRCNSRLMWSHYAYGHSGICIEVKLMQFNDELVRVKYIKENSELELNDERKAFMYKLNDWKYEREYRLILKNNIEYVKVAIKKVIISQRFSFSDNSKILSIIKNKRLKLCFGSFLVGGKYLENQIIY